MLNSKKIRGKRYFVVGVMLLLFVQMLGALTVYASDIPAATSDFYVNDYANILSDETEEYVVKVNEQLYEKCGAQVVITTIESLNGAVLEEYATDMFRTYGIGDADKNNGVLILLALEDRACRMEIGYGLEGAINDAKSGRIQDDYMIPYFRDSKWDEGMRNGFDAIVEEVAKEYNIEVESNAPTVVKTQEPTKERVPWYKNSNTIGCIFIGIALACGLFFGIIITNFWVGILSCLLAPVFGAAFMQAVLPEMDLFILILSDFGVLVFYFAGFIFTTNTVEGSSGSSGGYSGGSSYSSHSSSSSHHSSGGSSHHSGGGGRSGGGGSSRRF